MVKEKTIYQRFKQLRKELDGDNPTEAYDSLREPSFEQEILKSGSPELIANYFYTIDSPEKVKEHFGKDSLEYQISIFGRRRYRSPLP